MYSLGCRLLKIICIWSLSDGLSIILTIFPRQWDMKEEMDLYDLCLKASSFLLNTSTIVLNQNCCKTLELTHPMSCVVRTPKMWTNVRLHRSKIKETWWSSMTRLTHGPSSQSCRVENEYRDNQHPCTSQCQPSWTWPVSCPLVYYQDHPKQLNYQILSTTWYGARYYPCVCEYP